VRKSRIYTIAAVVVVLIVVLSAFSISYYYSHRTVERKTIVSLPLMDENFTLDPFNNTSGMLFTVTFNLTGFPGGTVDLVSECMIHSIYLPDTYSENSTIFNMGKNSSYGIRVSSSSLFLETPLAEYGWIAGNTSLFYTGGPVLEWNNQGLWSWSGKLALPPGNYTVSDKLWYVSAEPSQAQLNVTHANSWVNLVSVELDAWINSGSLTVSEVAVSL